MSQTVSVSKGCFALKKRSQSGRKSKSKTSTWNQNHMPWYAAYRNLHTSLKSSLEAVHLEFFPEVLKQLVQYVKKHDADKLLKMTRNEIVSATLLTGVNLPDHDALFAALSTQLREQVSPHIATLQAQSCTSTKSAIEHMVAQFVSERPSRVNGSIEEKPALKKNQCNVLNLECWYKEVTMLPDCTPKKKPKYNQSAKQNVLIVIIPELESFSKQVLQTLVLIASNHARKLPFIFIFGVATTVSAVHRSLPYHVLSKLQNQVFQTQPSTMCINQVLEEVFLSSNCPFHLEEKVFRLLTDVFLFYDFSVHGFIQGFNYCMMEHFFNSNYKSLCCNISELPEAINKLTKDDLENIRMLPSFRKYVDSLPKNEKAPLLLDDMHTKAVVSRLITDLHKYLFHFHMVLHCLHTLSTSLPKAPLGKHLREVYSKAISSPVCESESFKESFQLLGFLSQEDLVDRMQKVIAIIQKAVKSSKEAQLSSVEEQLSEHFTRIKNAGLKESPKKFEMGTNISRSQLKEKLLEFSRTEKLSPFEVSRKELLDYLIADVFAKFLVPANTMPCYEIFFFSNISKVKPHIVGLPRASLHMALNNPHFYLQCKCCELENSFAVTPTLPDVSIVYKLHLECGRLINMYDWLQAFLTIVSPNETGEEQRRVSPELQARFTHAVAELQFLGFIKTSQKKTDHVMRLTWGGS